MLEFPPEPQRHGGSRDSGGNGQSGRDGFADCSWNGFAQRKSLSKPARHCSGKSECYCVGKSIRRCNCEPINKRNPGREGPGGGDSLTKWRRRDSIAEWTRGIPTGSRRQSRRKKEITATPRNGTKLQRRA